MTRTLALLAFAFSAPALAAPFIACDLDARATHSAIAFCTTINNATTPPSCSQWGAWSSDAPAAIVGAAKECRHDIASAAQGQNMVVVKAIAVDPAWGRQESAPSAPFSFTRPASPAAPATIRIAP